MSTWRPAHPDEAARLWPLARTAHLARSEERWLANWRCAPWALRVSDSGDVLSLRAWRAEGDALAIRAVWAAPARVGAAIAEARTFAHSHGFRRLLSPLTPEGGLGPYVAAGMSVLEHVVALQGAVTGMANLALDDAAAVAIRPAGPRDISALLAVDAAAFDELWRYGRDELAEAVRDDRVLVASGGAGDLVGYAASHVQAGACTIARVAVATPFRRCGVATLLLAASGKAALHDGALTVTLCTQEHNAASRSLYAKCGLAEVAERYAIASLAVTQE